MPISAAVPFSLFFRVVVKTIVDFSGNLTLRNPFEVGGTYFTFTLLTTQVAMIVVAGVYNEHAGGANKLDAALVTGGAWALSAAWAGVFLFFIAFQCVPTHRWTFFSPQTGWQMSQSYFLANDDDETRMLVFGCNTNHWERDLGEEVKEFTVGNWTKWCTERPEWFDAVLVSTVPDEYIPEGGMADFGGFNRERRGSAARAVRSPPGGGGGRRGLSPPGGGGRGLPATS